MEPTLRAGDLVFVDTRVRAGLVADDDIVVARHPHRSDLTLVKRVAFTDEHGRLYLQSDNTQEPEAADSRSFGPVEFGSVLGRVTSRLRA